MATKESTLGEARFNFADRRDVEKFVSTLAQFESGEIDADAWRAFRLVNGTYGQRQEGDLSMLRAKIPQGVLSADQLDALADVAERFSRGFLHLTTRQNIQLHFVQLGEVGGAMGALADAGFTTRAACGNAVRNVTTSPTAGVAADEAFDATPYARALTRYLLDHELATSLPRKFKIAVSGGGSDHSFALINDLGWHARIGQHEGETVRGFRLTVGGGTAVMCTSGNELFSFIPASHMFAAADAVLKVFHARGDRVHRHKNRMKFLIKQMGWEAWSAEVRSEYNATLANGAIPLPFDPEAPPFEGGPPAPRARPVNLAALEEILRNDAPRGPGIVPRYLPTVGATAKERFRASNVRQQKQPGFVSVTVTVPLGDLSGGRLRALALLAREFSDGTIRTTIGQNLLLRWVREDEVAGLFAALRQIGLAGSDPESLADASSCPGAESCKLAVTQSRELATALSGVGRADPELVDRAAGLVVKVSGCPNGCGLHHVAGLGFQGGLRKVGGRPVPQYHVYAGGDASGDTARFGRVIGKVPARRAPLVAERLIALYQANRTASESITSYLGRAGLDELRSSLLDLEHLDEATALPEDFADQEGETAVAEGGAAALGAA